MMMIRALEHITCEDGQRELWLFSLGKKRLQGDLRGAFQYLKVPTGKTKKKSLRECSNAGKGNSFRLKEGRLRLEIRKEFFTTRVVRCQNRLPRDAVNVSSLGVFKARLDRVLSDLV